MPSTDMDIIETLRLSFLDEQLSIQRRCEKMGGEHGRRLGTGHRYRFVLTACFRLAGRILTFPEGFYYQTTRSNPVFPPV